MTEREVWNKTPSELQLALREANKMIDMLKTEKVKLENDRYEKESRLCSLKRQLKSVQIQLKKEQMSCGGKHGKRQPPISKFTNKEASFRSIP